MCMERARDGASVRRALHQADIVHIPARRISSLTRKHQLPREWREGASDGNPKRRMRRAIG